MQQLHAVPLHKHNVEFRVKFFATLVSFLVQLHIRLFERFKLEHAQISFVELISQVRLGGITWVA